MRQDLCGRRFYAEQMARLVVPLGLILVGCGGAPAQNNPGNGTTGSSPTSSTGGPTTTGPTSGTTQGTTTSGGSTTGGGTTGGGTTGGGTTGGGTTGGAPVGVMVDVLPRSTTVMTGGSASFSATVDGSANAPVTWSIDQADCGSVSDTGMYAAPAAAPAAGFCHVRATSVDEPLASAAATVLISGAPSGGEPGVWTQQPLPISLAQDGDGAQTLLADPVRPSDLYVMVTPNTGQTNAVLKSTDYGQTFTDVNNSNEFKGSPWGAAIDPSTARDPQTPPTMYSPAGYGALGAWKSTDGGVTWRQLFTGNKESSSVGSYSQYWPPDLYQTVVLPDDPPNHVLVTFHAGGWAAGDDCGFFESTDGGQSWVVHEPPRGIGRSHYLVIVDAETWISISEDADQQNGTWRTTTAGRVNGQISPEAWEPVDSFKHLHGSFQAYIDPQSGDIYMPGLGGIKKSSDKGATWRFVHDIGGGNYLSSVVGTETFLYANYIWGPNLIRASKSSDTSWGSYADAPSSMGEGAAPFGSAAVFDGTHWVIVMNADRFGVFRYVEP